MITMDFPEWDLTYAQYANAPKANVDPTEEKEIHKESHNKFMIFAIVVIVVTSAIIGFLVWKLVQMKKQARAAFSTNSNNTGSF